MVGKIKGTGSYRPVQVWDNDKLSHMMDTSDEWIRGRTGIGQRHIASGGETVAYMAARAAEEALSDAGMRPEEIDFLLVSTMSSERIMPCAACEVQKLIGAVNAACFDLNGACTGFLLALNTAQAYLGQQIYRRALVIGSETLSHLTNWEDRSTCVLFGDGAGAAVFELTDTSAPFAITLGARGDAAIHAGGPSRAGSAPISMDGRAVFRFAVDALPKCLHTVLDETGLTLDNLDWVVCHQANSRIIDHCVKALHADGAKFYKNMDRHGNTSAASIPVALNELAESGQLHPGQTLACIGFGGGLTWGGMIVEYKG